MQMHLAGPPCQCYGDTHAQITLRRFGQPTSQATVFIRWAGKNDHCKLAIQSTRRPLHRQSLRKTCETNTAFTLRLRGRCPPRRCSPPHRPAHPLPLARGLPGRRLRLQRGPALPLPHPRARRPPALLPARQTPRACVTPPSLRTGTTQQPWIIIERFPMWRRSDGLDGCSSAPRGMDPMLPMPSLASFPDLPFGLF